MARKALRHVRIVVPAAKHEKLEGAFPGLATEVSGMVNPSNAVMVAATHR